MLKTSLYSHRKVIVFWIFRAKCAATEAAENTMASTVAMDARDFLSEAFIEIASTHAKQRAIWKDAAQLIKHIEINAVHVDCPNAFNLLWTKMVSNLSHFWWFLFSDLLFHSEKKLKLIEDFIWILMKKNNWKTMENSIGNWQF